MELQDLYPILAIAIFPLIIFVVLLVYVWYKDKYEKEPKSFVISMFIWGVIAALIAIPLENALGVDASNAFMMLIFVPILEEVLKSIGIIILSRNPEFEGIMDGVVYGVAVGAGFALMSDILYGVSILSVGVLSVAFTLLLRAMIEPISHPFFSAWFGAEVGKTKIMVPTKRGYRELTVRGRGTTIFIGLVTVITLHAIWNYIAVSSLVNLANTSIYALMIIVLYILLFASKIKEGVTFDMLIYEKAKKSSSQEAPA